MASQSGYSSDNLSRTWLHEHWHTSQVSSEWSSFEIGRCFLILWATLSAAGPRPLLIAPGLQILAIVASGSWHFWCANLSFGMLGGFGFTLASWGTLGRSLDAAEHNE